MTGLPSLGIFGRQPCAPASERRLYHYPAAAANTGWPVSAKCRRCKGAGGYPLFAPFAPFCQVCTLPDWTDELHCALAVLHTHTRTPPPANAGASLIAFQSAVKTAPDSMRCTPQERAERVSKRDENRPSFHSCHPPRASSTRFETGRKPRASRSTRVTTHPRIYLSRPFLERVGRFC